MDELISSAARTNEHRILEIALIAYRRYVGSISPEVQAALDNLIDVAAVEARHGQEQA